MKRKNLVILCKELFLGLSINKLGFRCGRFSRDHKIIVPFLLSKWGSSSISWDFGWNGMYRIDFWTTEYGDNFQEENLQLKTWKNYLIMCGALEGLITEDALAKNLELNWRLKSFPWFLNLFFNIQCKALNIISIQKFKIEDFRFYDASKNISIGKLIIYMPYMINQYKNTYFWHWNQNIISKKKDYSENWFEITILINTNINFTNNILFFHILFRQYQGLLFLCSINNNLSTVTSCGGQYFLVRFSF